MDDTSPLWGGGPVIPLILSLHAHEMFPSNAGEDFDKYDTISEGNLSLREIKDFLEELEGLFCFTTY